MEWSILFPTQRLVFSMDEGGNSIDETTLEQLQTLTQMKIERMSLTDGFLHLFSKTSHLDLRVWSASDPGDSPHHPLPIVGQGQFFVDTAFGSFYFFLKVSDRQRIQIEARVKPFWDALGPFSDLHLFSNEGRLWLRMVRSPPHPNREYLVQKSTF